MGVTHHCVLWSPDFPLFGFPNNDRPAGSQNHLNLLYALSNASFLPVDEASRFVSGMDEARRFVYVVDSKLFACQDNRMSLHMLDWQQTPPSSCQGGAVAVGNFDGVHRGHATLIAEVRRLARLVNGPAVVLTFDPHPLQLLRPDRFLPVLTTTSERSRLLHAAGISEVILLRMTQELLHLSPEEFFHGVLVRSLGLQALVEGEDFRFGHQRAGNIELLRSLCQMAAVRLSIVPPLTEEGTTISSSQVRSALERGDVEGAANLLGRPYRLQGRVGQGAQRGRTLGFPTANLDPLYNFAPGHGVYAVRVDVAGNLWPGAANIGPNPTFGEKASKVEVHLIGFNGDLYGKELSVDCLARLRDTKAFSGVNELREQLRKDIERACTITACGLTR